MSSGASLISKKNKRTRILKIRDPEKFLSPGGKKEPDPGSGSATLTGIAIIYFQDAGNDFVHLRVPVLY
jgi:hypothetical protein